MRTFAARITNNVSALINALEPFLPILVAVFYFLCNKDFVGLQYNTDEFGYISKMIFLSGHEIVYPSQWRFGFSLLLLPVAWLTRTQSQFWFNFVIYQSLIWCATFYMLRRFITYIRPDISATYRFFILLLCSFYPSWCIMTGYAFTTTMMVFLYMAIITLICRWDGKSFFEPAASAALAGIFYWMHPLALAVFIPLLVAFAVNSRDNIQRCVVRVIAILAVLFLFCVSYKFLSKAVDERISDVISPPVHYISGFRKDIDFVLLIGMFFSHFCTLGLTTLGVGFCGLSAGCHQMLSRFFKKIEAPLPEYATGIVFFCVLSVFAAVAESVLFFGLSPQPHFQHSYYHWLYCRYLENFTLPLLALCFLVKWKTIYFWLPSLTFLASWFGLHYYASTIQDNMINTLSLAVKNVCEYFKLLVGPDEHLVSMHLLYSFAFIFLFGLFARFKFTKKLIFVPFIFCGIIGILRQLDRHSIAGAAEYHNVIVSVEKSGLENEVTWDSFLHRNRKPLTYYEYTHYSYPRSAFWTAKWSFGSTQEWLKHKRGILITDFVLPLLSHDDLFIYRTRCPPHKYIAARRALSDCKDIEVTGIWETGRFIPAKEFLCRYVFPPDKLAFKPQFTDIYFLASPDVKYLYLKLSDKPTTPFFLNGKKLVPLFADDSLWMCFDVSGIIQSCNELVYYPSGKELKPLQFRIDGAKLSDRLCAEAEFFTATAPPPAKIYVTGNNEATGRRSLVVPPGQFQYGPYVSLPPGTWQVMVQGTNLEQAAFDVHYSSGAIKHISPIKSVRFSTNCASYVFSHVQPKGQFEFRCQNRGRKNLAVMNIQIKPGAEAAAAGMPVTNIPLIESPGVPLNYKFSFTRPQDELKTVGFYAQEKAGKWASGKVRLDFRLKELPENGLVLKFNLSPRENNQTMLLKDADGNLIKTMQFTRSGDHYVTLDREYFRKHGRNVVLQLEFPLAGNPGKNDLRTLSCFFHSIELIPGDIPAVSPGGIVGFNQPTPIARRGFSRIEDWGVWTTDPVNTAILFALPENRKSETVQLQFTCQAYEKMKAAKVYCNGKFAATWNITKQGPTVYDLKLDIPLSERFVELRFEQFDLASPYELHKSDDRRRLGLGFVSMKYLP